MPKRNDPLRAMRARKQISADQYRAGRQWQKLYRRAATAALGRCTRALGQDGDELVRSVLADGQRQAHAGSELFDKGGKAFRQDLLRLSRSDRAKSAFGGNVLQNYFHD